tara:strand:- start:108 stop:995 length:888 start_codon:yes stop_codon:yes gene_type:complete
VTDSNIGHIAVVANDAGAAAHIFAWLKSGFLNIDRCKFCLDGPAARLFRIQQPNIKLLSMERIMTGAEKLLTGTGWSSSLEHDARTLAKNNDIKSIAVIDHWVNYRERFIRNNLEILPDEIWVSDKYAYNKARITFPNIQIIEQKNDYLKAQAHEVLSYKIEKKKGTTNILYLLEPIRDKWAGDKVAGEFQALDFFVQKIPDLNLGKDLSIILKPHPSDSTDKYDDWVRLSNLQNIHIEKEKNLASLLAWSDVVVGCETYAMVLALRVYKRVISSLPMNAHNCRLPFEKIERLNQ